MKDSAVTRSRSVLSRTVNIKAIFTVLCLSCQARRGTGGVRALRRPRSVLLSLLAASPAWEATAATHPRLLPPKVLTGAHTRAGRLSRRLSRCGCRKWHADFHKVRRQELVTIFDSSSDKRSDRGAGYIKFGKCIQPLNCYY